MFLNQRNRNVDDQIRIAVSSDFDFDCGRRIQGNFVIVHGALGAYLPSGCAPCGSAQKGLFMFSSEFLKRARSDASDISHSTGDA